MIKKVSLLIISSFFLNGCAALSAIKGFVGSGDSTDRSINAEANIAARDNNKSIISSKHENKYSNKRDVIQNGIMTSPLNFSKLMTYPKLINAIQEVFEELIVLLFFAWLIKYLAGRDERILKRKNSHEIKIKKIDCQKKPSSS